MEKRDGAFSLYKAGYKLERIAKLLSLSATTMTKWRREDEWDKRIRLEKELHENNAFRVQKLISYQLRTLERMVEEWEATSETKLIDKGSIDALSKLYATIKKKDITWTNYIDVMSDFMRYINTDNPKLAKELTSIMDEFLNEKRKLL